MIRLAVRVQREAAELVLAELLELAPGGIEEVALDEHTVEYAVYGAPGELPGLPDLTVAAGDALVEISTTTLADDWQERWRDFHKPVLVAASSGGQPAVLVRPPWEPAGTAAVAGEVEEIVIDPGQAFGTGGHATTRFCLALLLELAACDPGRGGLLDVGTGSGVLAIAAGKLGYGPLLGLDNERESVAAAEQNAAVNGVELQARRYELRSEALPWSPVPHVLTANLLRPLLLELAQRIREPPPHLIAGGLLEPEADEIADAFADTHGLRERRRLGDGQWAALWLARG
ncbi:MAG: 50S ribosomal protein L11 methyltransferase [Solirubrobacteraceae bacterium]